MEIEELRSYMDKEAKAIQATASILDQRTLEVAKIIENTPGKVIFLGVGKSGHIGSKLAATFASLGIPSFFIEGTEACHGDLGMIDSKDTVILISYSGKTKEVLQDIAPIKALGAKTVAFTSHEDSPLAKGCDYLLLMADCGEADPLGLAPTNSSTATLALGDALACLISHDKGFTRSDFHMRHPNGALGETLAKEGK